MGKTYIFLDYDGVVACARKWWKHGFEPQAITNLNQLVNALEESGRDVRVVPITSRLRYQPVSVICNALKKAGFTGEIETGTEALGEKYFPKQVWVKRGTAIKNWCKDHLEPEDSFVILDNNHPKNLPETMKLHLVRVDSYDKLTAQDVEKALQTLGVERQPVSVSTVGIENPHESDKAVTSWLDRVLESGAAPAVSR